MYRSKLLLLFSAYILAFPASAQIYGALAAEYNLALGNIYGNYGCVYRSTGTLNSLTILKEFKATHKGSMAIINSRLYATSNTIIYGACWEGTGTSGNQPLIYKYNASTDTYSVIAEHGIQFNSPVMQNPVLHSDGFYYGILQSDGTNSLGAIYRINPSNDAFSIVYSFAGGGTGQYPLQLIIGTDNKLWGIANGGTGGVGVIFSFDPATSTYQDAYHFTDFNWYGRLSMTNSGIILGTINNNTPGYPYGGIYAFNPTTSQFSMLHAFSQLNGRNSYGSFLINGNSVWGHAQIGGANTSGVYFRLDLSDTSYHLVHSLAFPGYSDNNVEAIPYPGNKLLFVHGGSNLNSSHVKVLDTLAGSVSNLISVPGLSNNLSDPAILSTGELLFCSDEAMFCYNPTTGTIIRRFKFNDRWDGDSPFGYMSIGRNGNLFGTTVRGGKYNQGVIFEYNLSTSTYQVLKHLNFTYPNSTVEFQSGIAEGKEGIFYGYMKIAAPNNYIFFEYNRHTDQLRPIQIQSVSQYGDVPFVANDGRVYGSTIEGGQFGHGSLFVYDPVSDTLITYHHFNNTEGKEPREPFTQLPDGTLISTTFKGGTMNQGVLYSVNPLTLSFTSHLVLGNTYGGSNISPVQYSHFDNLFLISSPYGGPAGNGSITSVDPAFFYQVNNIYLNNNISTGYNPVSKLWFDGYGSGYFTCAGGVNNDGTLVKLNLTTGSATKIYDFYNTSAGDHPSGDIYFRCSGEAQLNDSTLIFDLCETEIFSATVNPTGSNLNYKWFKNGVPVSGQTTSTLIIPSISYGDSGVYHCMVYNACGYIVSAPFILDMSACLSTAEKNLQNPLFSLHQLNSYQFLVKGDDKCRIKVYEVSGKEIFSSEFNTALNFELPYNSTGIYIFHVSNELGSYTQRFFIDRR